MEQIGFLSIPAHTPQAQALFDEDEAELGYLMNVSRLWAYQPATMAGLFELMRQSLAEANLSSRQRGILVAAAASSAGFADAQIFAMTTFVALRLAFLHRQRRARRDTRCRATPQLATGGSRGGRVWPPG